MSENRVKLQRDHLKKRLNKVTKALLKATNGLDVIVDDESYYPFDSQYCKDNYVKKSQ
jgi:hypothetical protein